MKKFQKNLKTLSQIDLIYLLVILVQASINLGHSIFHSDFFYFFTFLFSISSTIFAIFLGKEKIRTFSFIFSFLLTTSAPFHHLKDEVFIDSYFIFVFITLSLYKNIKILSLFLLVFAIYTFYPFNEFIGPQIFKSSIFLLIYFIVIFNINSSKKKKYTYEFPNSHLEEISHLKKNENNSLRKQIEVIISALDKAAIISITDRSGKILSINKNFIEISGHSMSELIGKTHQVIKSHYHSPEFYKNMWKTISSGKIWRGEVKNKKKDGSYYWVDSTIVPLLNSENQIYEYMSVRFDITEKKVAESDLFQKQIQLNTSLEAAKAGTFEHDIQTLELRFDKNTFEVLEVNPKEFDKKFSSWKKIIFEEDLKDFTNHYFNTLSGARKNLDIEYRIKTPSGNIKWIVLKLVIKRDEENIPLLVTGLNMDITEHKEIEKIRKEREAAILANESKSLFLANISHELRTPLHAILSYSQFGLKAYRDHKFDDLGIFFNNINSSGNRLLSLVDNLLNLSKLEANKVDLNKRNCNLYELISSCIKDLKMLAKDNALQIELKSNIENHLCHIDSERIRQVIINILSNAIKFSPENKKIFIEIDASEIKLDHIKKLAFLITISDEGVGIPEKETEIIFDKFAQSSKTSTKAGGTGLGLSVSKEIIELHRGKIWAESSKLGAIFKILIPQNLP